MRCRALRGFYLMDKEVKRDSVVDVPDHLVRQLELTGKIERAPVPSPAPKPEPAKPAKPGPMTTANAPGLVPSAPAGNEKESKS